MYSVILMAALTTGVDVPDLGRRGGCCGGCYGGCYGGCHGGRHGGRHGGGCCGCMGYSYGCMGYGCMGMGYGGCMGMGYGGCYGGGMYMPGTIQQGTSGEHIKKKPDEKKKSMLPAPATLVVELPADAKLLIDNEATTSTGSSRVFQSPVLNPGKEYHYTLKAEIVRNGKPVKVEQVVTFEPGEIKSVKMTLPAAGVAQR